MKAGGGGKVGETADELVQVGGNSLECDQVDGKGFGVSVNVMTKGGWKNRQVHTRRGEGVVEDVEGAVGQSHARAKPGDDFVDLDNVEIRPRTRPVEGGHV